MSPRYRNYECINCPYLLDCVEKEKVMDKTTRPECYGTQPKPDTVLWDERKCAYCINLESCYRVTFGVGNATDLKRAEDYEKLKAENPDVFKVTVGKHTPIEGIEGAFVGESVKLEFGTKLDQTKPRWSLLPSGTIDQVIAVLEFGAKKYAVNGWTDVPNAKTRYYDAAMRHLDAWYRGEKNDEESGLPHLAHAACCLLFLMWFDGKSVS
jgi:hypothetical protein